MELVVGIAGIVGALVGVVLGAWLTGRNERLRQREADRRQDRRERLEAAVAFLAAYRRFRRFVLTDDPEVVLAPGRGDAPPVPLVRRGKEYGDAVQECMARIILLEGHGSPVVEAARAVGARFSDLAASRAHHGPGTLPDDVVDRARDAEKAFADTVRREVG